MLVTASDFAHLWFTFKFIFIWKKYNFQKNQKAFEKFKIGLLFFFKNTLHNLIWYRLSLRLKMKIFSRVDRYDICRSLHVATEDKGWPKSRRTTGVVFVLKIDEHRLQKATKNFWFKDTCRNYLLYFYGPIMRKFTAQTEIWMM